MTIFDINGIEMSAHVRGTGEPLFLLHGMFGAAANWDLVFPDGIDGFRTIAPDLRGHGHSTNPSGRFSIRQCGDDVLALADALNIERFSAIGLSLGGNAMLHAASSAPDRVETMVVVSATPYFPDQARAAMAAMAAEGPAGAERDQMRVLHARGDDQIAELLAYADDMRTRHDDMDFTPPKLGRISARTLVVHGDRDPLYPIDMPVELHRSIPDSSLWVLPDAGHGDIFTDNAATFAATSIRFLTAATWNRPA
jgi:pimeloyl-ACP methyl ester carboxylesterase